MKSHTLSLLSPTAPRSLNALLSAFLLLFANAVLALPPVIVSVTPNATGSELYVRYSQTVCPYFGGNFGAIHIPNYTLAPSATITTATLLGDNLTVRLDFAPALSGGYVLQVNPVANYAIYGCGNSNALVGPVFLPFTVVPPAGPQTYYVAPGSLATDCSLPVTVYGSGFDATATVELNPGSIAGIAPVVSGLGTTLTTTFPSGLTPGIYTLTVKNPSGATVYPGLSATPYSITVQPVTIQSSWPHYASSCSSVNITAQGVGICPGATFEAKETGGSTIVSGTSIIISPMGDQISASFNFSGAPGASYDLVVKNPGSGGTTTLPYALSVSSIYSWMASPNRVGDCAVQTMQIAGSFCPTDNVRLVPVGAGSTIPGSVTSVVPTSFSGDLMTADFNVAGATPGVYRLEAQRGAGPWSFHGVTITIVASAPCPLDLEIVGRNTVGFSVVNPFTVNVRNLSCSAVPASTLTVTIPSAATPILSAATAGGVIAPANVITYAIPALSAGALHPVSFDMQLPILGGSINLSAVSSASGCGPVLHPITVVASQDPNCKKGLEGKGVTHRIRGDEWLPYAIHFENIRTATAPAQNVFINDYLNPAHFDLATFSLGDITFGSHTITPPAGLTSYSDIVPVDLDGNPATTTDQLLLVLKAELITNPADPDLGRLTWSYRSLDPATLARPLDPFLGFLPPNQLPPLGEGSVKFTVKAQPGLPSGTQIGSAAIIIFDANLPISTAPWLNEVAPCDQVLAVPSGESLLSQRCCTGNNTLNDLFAGASDGSTVRTYNNITQEFSSPALRNNGQWTPNLTITAGQGFHFTNPGPSFVAEFHNVKGDSAAHSMQAGYNLLGTATDHIATFQQLTGLTPREGDAVIHLVPGAGYETNTYTFGFWELGEPEIYPGEAVFVLLPSQPPSLSITRVQNQMRLTWTGAPGAWKLETTTVLPATSWTPVNILPTIPAYNRQSVLMSMSGSKRFFRLRKL